MVENVNDSPSEKAKIFLDEIEKEINMKEKERKLSEEEMEELRLKEQMCIAMRITLARKSIGLSQKEFADRLGETPMQVSRWEGGLFVPDAIQLKKISELTKKGLEYFYQTI